nr:gliding motility-associated C-terminal domain-containing protein [Saprospiraceae bacterium]
STSINGLATPNEYLASDCAYTLDLDGDDSSGSSNGNFSYITCVVPSPVADSDLVLQSGYHIDSIVIDTAFLQTNGNDFPFEYLTAGTTPNITVLGNGTNRLVLVNAGTASSEDFSLALLSVLYHNDAVQPTTYLESKDYEITVWSQSAGQQLSRIFTIQYWPFPVFSLGSDTTLCNGEALLLATPTQQPGTWPIYSTTWQDGSNANTFNVVAPGTYTAIYEATDVLLGCTWSDTITVSAGQPTSTQSTIQGCTGESIILNGQSITADTTVCNTTMAFSGCDSTHCTTVVFLPLLQASLTATICQGDAYSFNGQQLTQPGTYLDTLASPNGCDTLLALDLSWLPTSFTVLDSSVCQGGSVNIGGQVFSTPGSHLATLPNANGCDSTVQLNLTVLPPSASAFSATICEGSSYPFGGSLLTAPGSYQATLPSWLGCDSTVSLTLSVVPTIAISLDTAICQGQTMLFGGQVLAQAGTYNYVATSPTACDTAFTLNLAILPLPLVNIEQAPNGCASVGVLLAASATPASSFVWSNLISGASLPATENGIYAVTATDANGCTSTATTTVVLASQLVAEALAEAPTCAGGTDAWVEITAVAGGLPPYSFSINGGSATSSLVFEGLSGGTYVLTAADASGCAWDTLLTIAEPPALLLDAGPDLSIAEGTPITLLATSSAVLDSVWWLPTDYLDCPTCQQTLALPQQSIDYQVFAIDENGCPASDEVSVQVIANSRAGVFAPNAFSPNGDGANDSFTLFCGPEIAEIEYLTIFDRWGSIVFHEEGLKPNELAQGWNGTDRGKDANLGIYTWVAAVVSVDGRSNILAGDVALVR